MAHSPRRTVEPVELPWDSAVDAQPPPRYSLVANAELTQEAGNLQANGRIDINLESKIARTLAKIIDLQQEDIHNPPPDYVDKRSTEPASCAIKLNIVVQIVGSRGDVQPFIALGTALKEHGHRVRIATHDTFEGFVHESGLEFYPIGGDPAQLMAFMVKNPGLIPQMKSLREGEVQKKQAMIATMLDGCWRSCTDDDPRTKEPFVADAIIANPPSFAHIHCAQALSIPVHLMFTMPWSSTRAFPHPLANLNASSMRPTTANWVSYGVVEWLTWQGLGDVINRWRASIDLDPVPATEGPSLAEALKVPFTYCWSPALMPKPQDWPAHIDVCGFFFRDTPPYNPPAELEDFLKSGPPPVYIGFGSIVVDDPQKLIDTVLRAVAHAGVRAIVSKGWSGISGNASKNIYYVDECPHEWLFQHVAAVVHHGGAGTTACGLRLGRPTAVVPFFGDQPFWGHMVARAGAGPKPIPYTSLTFEKLAAAIQFCLTPNAITAAQNIAQQMQTERDQAAAWTYRKGKKTLNLSKVAVQVLIQNERINEKQLRCYDVSPIYIENRRWDPLTGVLSASAVTGSKMLRSTGEMLYNPYVEYRRGRSPKPSSEGSTSPTDDTPFLTSATPSRQLSDMQGVRSLATAGNMVAATMKGFGKFTGTYFKGVVVDIPHAAAEGFRQVPRLYGEQPEQYGAIQDWKSGAIVGGKNFVEGMTDGLTGIFTKPVRGAREQGALGAAKGFMKGTIGLATKVPSAGLGLVAYPFYGISKSIEATVRGRSRKTIVHARLKEGLFQASKMQMTDEQQYQILEVFETRLRAVDT
ncbi:sterol glucosyltransferase [Aspergillus terreus]|uniref:Sterol glucosyltransferase n=1 Tax=Aspergillus terreus TaxID=33178 RepID=A0A5M3YMC0_ASPTE|nr:hypothetical protein ATETN484_0001062400 [Aspergillus terreus]GFF12480.1 sterol glucosyltransferase [Aspergillus terreus]